MKRLALCTFALGTSLLLSGCSPDPTDETPADVAAANWHEDANAAFAAAQEQGKPVLMDFTGSDWCPPCQTLESEVFSTEAFKNVADEEFVLLKLDFPRRTPQSTALKEQNAALAEKYGIEAFPTIVVADADGRELGRTEGYAPGQPDAWLTKVTGFAAQ